MNHPLALKDPSIDKVLTDSAAVALLESVTTVEEFLDKLFALAGDAPAAGARSAVEEALATTIAVPGLEDALENAELELSVRSTTASMLADTMGETAAVSQCWTTMRQRTKYCS